MSTVLDVFPGGVVSRFEVQALEVFDVALRNAVQVAGEAGVPKGFIVALLHGYAHQQTQVMVERA